MPVQPIKTVRRKPQGRQAKRAIRPFGDAYAYGTPAIGGEARKLELIRYCISLSQNQHPASVIAEKVQQKFKLSKAPLVTTVYWWLDEGKSMMMADIKSMQLRMRMDHYNELEAAKRKYYDIAMRDSLRIQKTKKEDGESVTYIDEDDFDRQVAACNCYIKLTSQQAQLLGLNIKDPNEEGQQDLAALRSWIIESVTNGVIPGMKKASAHEVNAAPTGEALVLEVGGDITI